MVTSITYYKIRVMFTSITIRGGDMFISITDYKIRVMFNSVTTRGRDMFNSITTRGRYGYLYYYKGEICLPSFCFKFYIDTDIK